MSDSEHDDEFEAYLKRQGPIHKGMTSLERPEPPPELDRIVIGNARKAIRSRSPVRLYRAPKWALPVGLAATILISFATLLGLGVRTVRQQQETATHASLRESRAPQAVAEPPPATALSDDSPSLSADSPSSASRSIAAASPVEPPAPVRLPPIPTAPWPPSPMESAPMASSSAAPLAEQPSDKARTRVARADIAARRSRTEGDSGPDADRRDHPDAAKWLARIERLRSGGLTAQAEQELKRLHQAYPQYPLPAAAAPADGRAQ